MESAEDQAEREGRVYSVLLILTRLSECLNFFSFDVFVMMIKVP